MQERLLNIKSAQIVFPPDQDGKNQKMITKTRWTVGNVTTVPVVTASSISYAAQLALSTVRRNKDLENYNHHIFSAGSAV